MIIDLTTLSIGTNATATMTFMHDGAGYRNAIGVYEIGEGGAISNVRILFDNASAQGSGGSLVPGVSTADFAVTEGTQVGFFIVPNAQGYGTGPLLRSGTFELRTAEGGAVTAAHDGAVYLYHIDGGGAATLINSAGHNMTYHTTDSEGGAGLNGDNYDHTRWTMVETDEGVRLDLGFEDLWRGGDQDFDDVMFRVDIGAENTQLNVERAAYSDLTATDLTLSATTPQPGEDLVMTVDVANAGGADAQNAATTFYWSPTARFDAETAVQLDTAAVGALDAGEGVENVEERVSFAEIEALGDGYIFAGIAETGDVTERVLTNNMTDGIEVTLPEPDPETDLAVLDLRAGDTSLEAGQDLLLSLSVANLGETDERAVTTYYWSATDTYNPDTAVEVGHDHHGKLKTGEGDFKGTERVRYEDLAELGDGYVFAVIESEDGTTDINEGNNVSDALSFTVAPAEASTIDLTVSAISAENTALAAGEDLELSLDVANLGNTDAHGTKTAIYWSEDNSFDAETDTLLAMDNHGQLNGGETERGETSSVDADDLADLGDGFIFAVIDHKDGIAESNESNNVSDALQITVGPADPAPRADLQISDASLDETRLEDGDDLTVEFDVLNAGVGEARGTVATAYWSATDTFDAGSAVALGTENVGFLEGGETDAGEDIRIRYEDLEGLGDGYIFVLLDAAGLVPETNTANNLSDALGFDLL